MGASTVFLTNKKVHQVRHMTMRTETLSDPYKKHPEYCPYPTGCVYIMSNLAKPHQRGITMDLKCPPNKAHYKQISTTVLTTYLSVLKTKH